MENKLMRNKYFLYFTGFFSGMSVMAIELGASRLLAPYFSSSQIVWTVIIGTIMIAMAIGNVWGGRSADKDPNPTRLYRRLLLAAIWTAAIPFVGKYIIAGISLLLMMVVPKNFLVVASFVSCIVLFVFPLMLLGTATPSLMKYATKSLDDNGKILGELEAFGTIGSILGTFLPTFVTIPTVGTGTTFLIFAGILAVISLAYFISVKKNRIFAGITAGVILLLAALPFHYSFAFWEKDMAYEGESIYNYLRVQEDEDSVILSTNVLEGVQSIMMKNGGLTGMYYDYALAAPMMADSASGDDQDVLILGMGTGTYAKQCQQYFPDARTEGVEIDEKIVELSREYFDLPQEIPVSVFDGRAYLQQAGKYDVIMVDAYQDITIPFQMSTVEFFTQVKDHLKDNGVMVVNMNMRSENEDAINDYLCDTIASVFPEVYTVVVSNGTNVELFASDNADMIKTFDERLEAISKRRSVDAADLTRQMESVRAGLEKVEGGERILTDDKAPVELLGMQVLDEMISDSVDYYKDMLSWDYIKEYLK